jgi:hypothetical protein
MTWATYEEAQECLDDFAAEHPLEALRRVFAECLTPYRLDAVATAEPAAAQLYAYDWLTPECRAARAAAARDADLKRFIPDRLELERRVALRRREGRS